MSLRTNITTLVFGMLYMSLKYNSFTIITQFRKITQGYLGKKEWVVKDTSRLYF